MTLLATFTCGCAAYQDYEGGWVVWGVRRCDAHLASGTLPIEAEMYFGLMREAKA